MRTVLLAAALTSLVIGAASAQPAPTPGGPICLRPFDQSGPGGVLRTHVVDPQTILFYTADGKVYENRLKGPCRGLMFHGFSYVTHQDEVCSNAQAIQVVESGEICELGPF